MKVRIFTTTVEDPGSPFWGEIDDVERISFDQASGKIYIQRHLSNQITVDPKTVILLEVLER